MQNEMVNLIWKRVQLLFSVWIVDCLIYLSAEHVHQFNFKCGQSVGKTSIDVVYVDEYLSRIPTKNDFQCTFGDEIDVSAHL